MSGKLYLIPNLLSEDTVDSTIPIEVKALVSHVKFFIVENIKTARRFIKKVDRSVNIDELEFFVLNKHTDMKEMSGFLDPLFDGNDIGIISEAGCPGVADPGAAIVEIAHRENIKVVPLVGPSSILLALMASGMNGQNFVFHGYLPINKSERISELRKIELKAKKKNQTQIFIETPFRNNQMLEDLIKTCQPKTKLCVASNITAENEFIKTMAIIEWKKKLPDLNKQPTIFLLYF